VGEPTPSATDGSFSLLLAKLDSAKDDSCPAGERDVIWEALSDAAVRHREFADARWAVPPEDVDRLDALAAKFRPESAMKRNARRFMSQKPHVPDVKRGGGDWHAYHDAVAAARAKTVAEIVASASGWQELKEYALSLRQPHPLGAALAEAAPASYETGLVGLLDSEESSEVALAFGYAEMRFRQGGWTWVEEHL
jgi:hypothetical protein